MIRFRSSAVFRAALRLVQTEISGTPSLRRTRSTITPSGTITTFTIPTASSGPQCIVPGSDGALWFTEYSAAQIGRIPTNATSGSDITEFATGITGSGLAHLTVGPDCAIWFTEYYNNAVGRIAIQTSSNAIRR